MHQLDANPLNPLEFSLFSREKEFVSVHPELKPAVTGEKTSSELCNSFFFLHKFKPTHIFLSVLWNQFHTFFIRLFVNTTEGILQHISSQPSTVIFIFQIFIFWLKLNVGHIWNSHYSLGSFISTSSATINGLLVKEKARYSCDAAVFPIHFAWNRMEIFSKENYTLMTCDLLQRWIQFNAMGQTHWNSFLSLFNIPSLNSQILWH